jgi:hypothetical protein
VHEPHGRRRTDAQEVIEYLRGRRVSVVAQPLEGGPRPALERSAGRAADELSGRRRNGDVGRPPPYWPADPLLYVIYAAGLAAAGAAVVAIRWLAPDGTGRLLLAALAAALFLATGFALVRVAAGRSRAHERVLEDPRDRATFEAATADANRILLVWPDLETMADPADPRSTIERALWDLALALEERGQLRAAGRALKESVTDLIGDGTVYVAVSDRAAQVASRRSEVEAEIHRRTGHLRKLADLCQRYVDERSATARARRRLRAVDALLGAMRARAGRPHDDAAADLTDHTEAVLSAYRDLARDLDPC